MQAPDPNGSQPADWRWTTENWLAYVSIAAGTSQRQTAKHLKVSPGTVTRWVKVWRDVWGAGLFKAQAQAATKEAQNAPLAPMHVEQIKADWVALRGVAAKACGTTASKARDLLDLALTEMLEDKDRRNELTARDLASLATAVDKMTKAADRLADIDPRTRKQDTGRTLDPSLLAGLEGNTEIEQVTNSVVVLMDEFRRQKEAS